MVQQKSKAGWLGRVALGVLGALTALSLGCSDGGPGTSTGNGGTGGGSNNAGPVYVGKVDQFSADFSMRTDYVEFMSSVKAGSTIDPSKTIEEQGANGPIFLSYQPGEYFYGDPTDGSVVKFQVSSNGSINQAGKISFGAYGVNTYGFPLFFVASSTKAYLFDTITFQYFVWNPSTMTITSNASVASKFNPTEGGKTYSVYPSNWGMLKTSKGKLITPYYYTTTTDFSAIGRSGIISIDTTNDTFSVVEHATCGGLWNSLLGADGLVYAASTNAYSANIFTANPAVAPTSSCLVRYDPEKAAFDDTYTVDLSVLAGGGGKIAGGLFPQSGGAADIRILNTSLLPPTVTMQAPPLIVGSSLAWETFRIADITAPMKTPLTQVKVPAMGIAFPVLLDGHTYAVESDLTNSTIWDTSAEPPVGGLMTKGWVINVLRVQ